MVQSRYAQLTLTQLVLYTLVLPHPEELMDPQLRRIDELLEDEELLDQVYQVLKRRRPQSSRRGRKGTPAEVGLRMLVLKHLRGWSFKELEREVRGSLVYRRFCRLDDHKVPDETTLVRLNQALEEPVLRALLGRVVEQAKEAGVTRGQKLRIDTTVVEAPIHYPTDSRACEDGVRVLRRLMERLVRAGVQVPFLLKKVGRSVSHRMREIGQALKKKGDEAREALKKPYRGLLRVTARLMRQAYQGVQAAKEQMEQLPQRVRAAVERQAEQLSEMAQRVRQVVRQTRARVFRGITNWPGKLLSLFEPWAQIYRRGKQHKATEFGALVKVCETEGGIVSDIEVVPTHNDSELLVGAVDRHIEQFGKAPRLVATDRGFYSARGEKAILQRGVKRAVIPKKGHRSPRRIKHERQRWFRRGRAWRAGGEARISRLKHTFGMARSRYRGQAGMDRTVLWAAIANNLAAIAGRTA